MLDIFMGQCARGAAYLEMTSLNDPIDLPGNGGDDAGTEVIDLVVDPLADTEAPLLAAEEERLVRDFVADLSPAMRCIVVRHFWGNQSQTDIAVDLGVTRSAVNHALARVFRRGRTNLAALAPC